jgi:hypothetical protein
MSNFMDYTHNKASQWDSRTTASLRPALPCWRRYVASLRLIYE